MERKDFINILLRLANETPTKYMLGGVGQNDGYNFLFDCAGLIKSVWWGFNFDYSKYRGGAIYQNNGLPDVGADSLFINYCYDIKTDFNNIEVGEFVWLEGHIGVYVGNNKVVESTGAWKNKVLISDITNDGTRSYNNIRCLKWTHHGKFKLMSYETNFKYRVHFSNIGWTKYYNSDEYVINNEKIEAIEIVSNDVISGMAHITKLGWIKGTIKDNVLFLGTTGKSLWLEAIKINTNSKIKCKIFTKDWTDETYLDDVITVGTVGMSNAIHGIKFTK